MVQKAQRAYSPEEDELIRASDLTIPQLAEQLGRSVWSIRERRYRLRNGQPRPKSAVARRRRQQRYRDRGASAQRGPNRTWTAQEDECIMAADAPSDAVLSHKINRTINAIQHRRHRLLHSTE